MSDSNRDSGRWHLDGSAFATLLRTLHPDRAVAAREYERLRRRLMRYFSLNGVARTAEAADEAFDRLAMRLSQGTHVLKVEAFLAGVARLLVLEERRRLERERRMLYQCVPDIDEHVDDRERFLHALEACLSELPRQSRELLRRYYCEGGALREREALAQELGLSANTLRNRILRLRRRLERAVRQRLDEASPEARSSNHRMTEEED